MKQPGDHDKARAERVEYLADQLELPLYKDKRVISLLLKFNLSEDFFDSSIEILDQLAGDILNEEL